MEYLEKKARNEGRERDGQGERNDIYCMFLVEGN